MSIEVKITSLQGEMDEIQPKANYSSQIPHSQNVDEKADSHDPTVIAVDDERLKAELSGDAEEMSVLNRDHSAR